MAKMQAPPSYSGPVRKKSNVGLIVGIVVAVLALCCVLPIALLVKGATSFMGGASTMMSCGNTLSNVRDGLVAYAKQHDGKLPPAENWQDTIQSLVKPVVLPPPFQNSSAADVCDAAAPSSIAYNTDVAGKKLADLNEKDDVVVLFEVPGKGRNQARKYQQLPFKGSPQLVMGAPRGWMEQPLHGDAYLVGQNGQKAPIGKIGQTGNGATAGK